MIELKALLCFFHSPSLWEYPLLIEVECHPRHPANPSPYHPMDLVLEKYNLWFLLLRPSLYYQVSFESQSDESLNSINHRMAPALPDGQIDR